MYINTSCVNKLWSKVLFPTEAAASPKECPGNSPRQCQTRQWINDEAAISSFVAEQVKREFGPNTAAIKPVSEALFHGYSILRAMRYRMATDQERSREGVLLLGSPKWANPEKEESILHKLFFFWIVKGKAESPCARFWSGGPFPRT